MLEIIDRDGDFEILLCRYEHDSLDYVRSLPCVHAAGVYSAQPKINSLLRHAAHNPEQTHFEVTVNLQTDPDQRLRAHELVPLIEKAIGGDYQITGRHVTMVSVRVHRDKLTALGEIDCVRTVEPKVVLRTCGVQ